MLPIYANFLAILAIFCHKKLKSDFFVSQNCMNNFRNVGKLLLLLGGNRIRKREDEKRKRRKNAINKRIQAGAELGLSLG